MLTLLAGCASVTVYRTSKQTSLENMRSIYVAHFAPDDRHLERTIADDLKLRGYNVSYGDGNNIPANVDTIVTYVDHWQWDLSNYMIDIEIEFRQAKDKEKIISAKSYRPSLQRKSPKEMIKEALDRILEQE